jgi:hypothetical protein
MLSPWAAAIVKRDQGQKQLLELLMSQGDRDEADQGNRAHRQRAPDDPGESVQGDGLDQCCRPATVVPQLYKKCSGAGQDHAVWPLAVTRRSRFF